jgi:ketosteroid isomerase-like protein
MRHSFIVLIAALTTACAASPHVVAAPAKAAGEPPSSELYQAIARQDSALSLAFNAHDLRALMSFFTADVEFYHDKGGLQSYADVNAGFGGMFSRNDDIKRNLVPGTLRVHPIKDFGAIELGTHQFCHTENGKPDCGSFEFVELWKNVGGEWKIARVVSYGH